MEILENMTLPETLYHATFPDAVDAILVSGLQHNTDGVVNLVNEPQFAAGFVAIRGFSRIGEITIINVNGVQTPNIDKKYFDTAQVLAINVRRLDIDKLSVNETETQAAKAGALPEGLVSYTYSGTIPREAIHIADIFIKNDSRIPPHFEP